MLRKKVKNAEALDNTVIAHDRNSSLDRGLNVQQFVKQHTSFVPASTYFCTSKASNTLEGDEGK